MSYLRSSMSRNFVCLKNCFRNSFVSNRSNVRHMCEVVPNLHQSTEKSVNRVTLLGRVGINPQLRGSETRPVVVFTLATNSNYRTESGDVNQKTDWHKITVFKPYLRDLVLDYLKKGNRIYVDGRLLYGEYSDANGTVHNTVSIVANEIIFVGEHKKRDENVSEEMENSAL